MLSVKRCHHQAFLLCLIALLISQSGISLNAADDLPKLLNKVPAGANAAAFIDAAALKKTQLAKERGWVNRNSASNAAAAMQIPPDAKTVVVSSLLDTSSRLETVWDVGVVSLESSIPMNSIMKSEAGYVDWLSGNQAVWSPANAYFVELESKILGVVYPADRQRVSRYVGWAKNPDSQSTLSPYLQKASSLLISSSQIVMAIDLSEAGKPHKIREAINRMPFLNADVVTKDRWADSLGNLQGLTLGLSISSDIKAALRVDFSREISVFAPHEKELLLHALNEFEASLPDMEEWDFSVDGNSIIARGLLSLSGLRRVMSLIELPSTQFDDQVDRVASYSEPVDSQQLMLDASLEYYNSVTTLIDDLRKTLSDTRDNHALWFERYGRKIDRLPILNVDPDLLNYGSMVSTTFRDIGLNRRTTNIAAGTRKSYVHRRYNVTNSGNWDGAKGSQVKSSIEREEDEDYSKMRFESWNEIENSTNDIRRTMTSRYGVEFKGSTAL